MALKACSAYLTGCHACVSSDRELNRKVLAFWINALVSNKNLELICFHACERTCACAC